MSASGSQLGLENVVCSFRSPLLNSVVKCVVISKFILNGMKCTLKKKFEPLFSMLVVSSVSVYSPRIYMEFLQVPWLWPLCSTYKRVNFSHYPGVLYYGTDAVLLND